MAGKTGKERPPRLRLRSDIDLTKADPECKGCKGTGIKGSRWIDDPENDGQKTEVPVICRCVIMAGGVQKDPLDEILEKTAQQLEDGTFARDLASDIMGLPETERGQAIMQLKRRAASSETEPKTREACFSALRLLVN